MAGGSSSLRCSLTPEIEHTPPLQDSPSSIDCFVDAAWQMPSRSWGMGILFLCNLDGRKIEHQASRRNISSALAGDAWAVREALIQAIDREFKEHQVLSDSLSLINILNSHDTHTEIHAIVNDIRLLALFFSSISFRFTPRSTNLLADGIAKQALYALLNS